MASVVSTFQVYPTFKAKVENHFVPMDLMLNSTLLHQTVTSNFLTEVSWYPFNSVTDEEAAEYERSDTIPAAWSARRDTLWVRYSTVHYTTPHYTLHYTTLHYTTHYTTLHNTTLH